MDEEPIRIILLSNSSFQCLPVPVPGQVQGFLTSITSSETFCTNTIKPKHGVAITLDISGISGTSASLTVTLSLPNYPQSINLTPTPITTTGTLKVYINEDGVITSMFIPSSGSITMNTIATVSLADLWDICLNLNVSGTSPSISIGAGYVISL